LEKGTLGDGGMGMPVEHQTSEAMGSIMPKKKKCRRALATNIDDEIGFKKTFFMIEAMKDMDGGPVTQAGFGLTDSVKPVDNSVMPKDVSREKPFTTKKVSQKQPESKISAEVKLSNSSLDKASYEAVAGEYSYTDETSPKDDSFYLPGKINGNESNDTSKDAKKKKSKTDELEQRYFGRMPERIGDQGKARANQNYNVGTIENAQIGNQGI